MKNAKKVLALTLCIMMLLSSMVNDGWSTLFKASAIRDHEQSYNDTRVELDFNKGWSFALSDDDISYLKGYNDSDWEKVDLPHDFSMSQAFTNEGTESESGSLPGGTGWYRKWFNLYDYYTGDRVIINFEGAYQHAYVYVNGQYVGENHYGYNSFSFEISDYVLFSNTELNLIAVKVVNDIPNSRWYSGSGLYRDVSLTIAGPVHTALYGPQITTPGIRNGDGTVEANVQIHNDTAISKKVTVEATILDADHNPVSDTVVSNQITIKGETEENVTLTPSISDPELWTLENPYLYKLKTVVRNADGEMIDEYHTTFGYRYIEWDADKGFKFNGEYMKLKGVSLHHDQGAIGAIQEYEALYRQVMTLKEMGCNAIRTTHNPASKALMEICNEVGMLVMVEFFDGWDASKNYNENDFSKYFNETISENNNAIGAHGQKWFEFVVEQTVLRDEHDPCVIAWDLGNELFNITAGESTANYNAIADKIIEIVKKYDSERVVLFGNNKVTGDEPKNLDDKMDVIGGNYAPGGWSYIMTDSSDSRSTKPFVATEAASAISSRGVYYTMTQDDATFQCTSYDTHAVSWGNEAAEAWYYVVTNDWFSGEFVWTGFDYIGEPTPWNGADNHDLYEDNLAPNSSYFGLVDTAGFEKDSYYLYRSWWNEDSTTLHLVPGSWNQDKLYIENGYVNVAVYSNAKKVELLLNGSVIATATSTDVTTNAGYTYKTWTESIVDSSKCSIEEFYDEAGKDLYPQFKVKYAAGELSVKAYDENNNEITDTVGSTKSVTGTATQVVVSTWENKDTFIADGTDYIYIEFEARDADGNFMNDYNGSLNVKVDDASARYAKIVGVDNGNPATLDKFQQTSVLTSDSQATIQMFNGKALVILKTTEEEGTINVTAIATDDSSSFSTEGVTVTSVSETGVRLTDEFEEVITQSGDKYEPTLYDRYSVVKHYVNALEEPTAEDSSEKIIYSRFEIYKAQSTTNGCIPDGDYVINMKDYVMSGEPLERWAIHFDNELTDVVWASGNPGYYYESFIGNDDNVYTFTNVGGNRYYIQKKNAAPGEPSYLSFDRATWSLRFDTTPQELTVFPNANGSVRICSVMEGYPNPYIYIDNREGYYFYGYNYSDDNANLWLYSKTEQITPSEPSEPSIPNEDAQYQVYFPDKNAAQQCVKPDDYVLIVDDKMMTTETIWDGWTFVPGQDMTDVVAAQPNAGYDYESFVTSRDNAFEFVWVTGNQYYIKNSTTGKYIYDNGWGLCLGTTPQAYTVEANDDGTVTIYYYFTGYAEKDVWVENQYRCFYYSWDTVNDPGQTWDHFLFGTSKNENAKFRLYSKTPVKDETVPYEKLELYNALHDGIKEDYSKYTRASFEALLTALEEGVRVFKDENSTNADYAAATQAIRDAINGLSMDIKKIDGTLFKYGYSNADGTPDYSSGGILMNDIAIRQMKRAILADDNLVNQLKAIIGYDDAKWAPGAADKALEDIAFVYAKLYTLQFTGVPYAGSDDRNAVSNSGYLEASYEWPLLTLWNVWTKDNTHGANDPDDWEGNPIHDGASVQGLAGSTLDKGVITSHSAYQDALSYSNDGPGTQYDITKYTFGFSTGYGNEVVTLEYLSGISVYFPDLFTRESLDASGNVTESTTGQYSKYYWDTEFPMFISTDEYGVNTYHYDSADTRYLIQASFDDENHTAEMELNDVGSWNIVGPNNASKSGFFPFNYQDGTTSNSGENAVYHYGFTFEHNFYIPKGGKHVNGEDVVFNFSGDDDVYVYIDGVLVLDNGGLHGARAVSINFTECSITYQYAMDVTDGKLKGDEYEVTYSYSEYLENPEGSGYNADTIAAVNKLHEVITDGEAHTLNFFYLERGASDSNCLISFNLSETSEDVRIIDQTLTLDYGLPVEYNITENNAISQAAIDNGAEVEYIGICAINQDYTPTYTFEVPKIILPFEDGVTYELEGMRYGTCTIDNQGNVSYDLKSMNMAQSESFYVVAKITGDPTYAEEIVYYQVEKTTFVPATAIYYEDTFDTITYTDGKVPTNYDNTANKFGVWETSGIQETTLKQTADLTDSEANPYGYETNYTSFAEYSGGSLHSVDVSTRNNPSSKYSGGTGGAWPTAEFTFTGTGFDLISITDYTSGALSVQIYDLNSDTPNKVIKSTVVDTFYGYEYGRVYGDTDGSPTLDSSKTPMYRAENGTCTSTVMYYDENGKITRDAHYYDANGEVVDEQTDNPAYAYAYGWVIAEAGTTETLYQIPVIKITGLNYSNYKVKITPTFTSSFGHGFTTDDGSTYYTVYLDAIKIYSSAGEDDGIADKEVNEAYATDDERYPNYLMVKKMLIGADSLGEDKDTQGIIFIDGNAALNNDIETYRKQGPNNELYLGKGQAVAFEIWATSVPTDVQIGTKLACGKPTFTVSYASKTTDLPVTTATDLYYSFNTILPNDGKLTWKQVDGSDGNKYYTTGTVVIQNNGGEDSVLSITNMKWTFSQYGGKGYFRIPTSIEDENLVLTTTQGTQSEAYSLVKMRVADLNVQQTQDTEVVEGVKENTSDITFKVTTSNEVDTLVITDLNGNVINPEDFEVIASQIEGTDDIEWTVTMTEDKNGTYTYVVAGAYENGYTNEKKTITITVLVDNLSNGQPLDLVGFYDKLISFFRSLLAMLGFVL